MLQPQVIAAFQKCLEEEHKALLDQINQKLIEAGQTTYTDWVGEVRDMEDESLADFLEDFEFSVIEYEVKKLKTIEEALARIKAGNYGQCVDCGDDIDTDRLQAFPTALRCHDCQEQFEHTYRQDPNPTL